jgi:hypothetical protein
MLEAASESLRSTQARIANVRYGPIVGGHETILFELDGVPRQVALRERAHVEHVFGLYPNTDRRVALAALLAE